MKTTSGELLAKIAETGEMDEDTEKALNEETDKFVKGFVNRLNKAAGAA